MSWKLIKQITPKTQIQSGNHIVFDGNKWRIYTGNEEEDKGKILSQKHIDDLLKKGYIKKIMRKDIDKKYYYHVL